MDDAGTSGGPDGTSGDARRRLAVAGLAAATLVIAAVNALNVATERAGLGRPLDPHESWVWELTSAAFWIAALWPIWLASRRLRPPARRWPAAVAAHLALTIPVCAAHVAWLALSRQAIYATLGDTYSYDWSAAHLLYEWRKDALTVLGLALLAYIVDRWAAPPPAAPPAEPPFRLEVRDGPRTRWLAPSEIERVEAAGNYVELHTQAGPLLHRATLGAVETALAPHGFTRIHRSRLVRRAAVAATTATASGDFTARLTSGVEVAGSRRFRGGLA